MSSAAQSTYEGVNVAATHPKKSAPPPSTSHPTRAGARHGLIDNFIVRMFGAAARGGRPRAARRLGAGEGRWPAARRHFRQGPSHLRVAEYCARHSGNAPDASPVGASAVAQFVYSRFCAFPQDGARARVVARRVRTRQYNVYAKTLSGSTQLWESVKAGRPLVASTLGKARLGVGGPATASATKSCMIHGDPAIAS